MPTVEVVTVRIPELPAVSTPDLANADCIPIWSSADNVTSYTTLQTLREFIEVGESGTYGPVQSGESVLYIVPLDKEGDNTVAITELAGKNFSLSRDGFPLIPQSSNPLTPNPDAEYEILGAGGFQLLNNTLIEAQRYELEVYEFATGAIPTPGSGGSGSGFIAGEVPVNTNLNISINDLNKLLQVRGAGNALNINLPDVSLCPAKSFVVIECLINNTKQHTIGTTAGQYIYINNESRTNLYLGKGEYALFYRTEDGWFVLFEKGHFNNLAMPKAAYKIGLNQLLCDGSELLRAEYPRLWEEAQTLGASLVSEATWNTASVTVAGRTVERPYRGCFSQGNGTTTFRIPDLMNMALRGLKSVGGSDAERHANASGNFQKNEVLSHAHKIWGQDNTAPASGAAANEVANVENAPVGDVATPPAYQFKTSAAYGGTETRMDNIGVLWVIDY